MRHPQKVDKHRNFVNLLLSHVFSSHFVEVFRFMLRSKAKADTTQSYFGDDAPVAGIRPVALSPGVRIKPGVAHYFRSVR